MRSKSDTIFDSVLRTTDDGCRNGRYVSNWCSMHSHFVVNLFEIISYSIVLMMVCHGMLQFKPFMDMMERDPGISKHLVDNELKEVTVVVFRFCVM